MNGYIAHSPSMDKNLRKCSRKAMLQTTVNIGNHHTRYGHAFGNAFSALHFGLGKGLDDEQAMSLALMEAMPHLKGLLEPINGKGFVNLFRCLQSLLIKAKADLEVYEYYGHERKITVRFDFDYKGTTLQAYISGTEDLTLKHRASGLHRISDAKAIAGLFDYSFATDPQVLHYGVLNELNGLAIEPRGEYVVHVAKGYTNLKLIELSPSMYQTYITGYVEHMISEAKKLATLAFKTSPMSFEDDMRKIYGNFEQCAKNEFECTFYDKCHKGESMSIAKYFDDRQPSAHVKLQTTEQDLKDAGERIRTRAMNIPTSVTAQPVTLEEALHTGSLKVDDLFEL